MRLNALSVCVTLNSGKKVFPGLHFPLWKLRLVKQRPREGVEDSTCRTVLILKLKLASVGLKIGEAFLSFRRPCLHFGCSRV